MLNLFLIHTPFHLLQAKMLISSRFKDDTNVLISDRRILFDLSLDQPFLLKILLPSLSNYAFGHKGFRHSRTIIEIFRHLAINNDCRIIISDINYQINNLVFFDSVLSKRCDFFLISDGALSYLEESNDFRKHLIDVCKRILYYFHLSYRATPLLGHVSGMNHTRVLKCFSFEDKYVLFPKEKIELLNFKIELPLYRKKVIFLGQPYDEYVCEEKWIEFVDHLISQIFGIFDRNEYTFYFKPHHCEGDITRQLFCKYGFVVVEDKRPIEEFILDLGVTNIASFNSSALINLKLINKSFRCISLKDKIVTNWYRSHNKSASSNENVFRSFDIEYYE